MMKRYQTCKTANCKPVHIEGSSLTIPGLAPDLQTLLAAAEQGEPLPRTSEPLFDESEEAGLVRTQVESLPPEDIQAAYETAKAKPEQAAADQGESASPSKEEASSEAQE